jgi:hypothetical protein
MKSRKELSDVQFTYEELAVIRVIFGRLNGWARGFPLEQRRSVYDKATIVFPNQRNWISLDINDLNSCEADFKKDVENLLSNNDFDTPETEVEELTLAQVCELLGKNIKIVKDK